MATAMRQRLPHGTHVVLRHRLRAAPAAASLVPLEVLVANGALRNRHTSRRCIVVGNGSGVKQIDLNCLQGETVFSVFNGNLHKGYRSMVLAYHCVPQITYDVMTEAEVLAGFRELDMALGLL